MAVSGGGARAGGLWWYSRRVSAGVLVNGCPGPGFAHWIEGKVVLWVAAISLLAFCVEAVTFSVEAWMSTLAVSTTVFIFLGNTFVSLMGLGTSAATGLLRSAYATFVTKFLAEEASDGFSFWFLWDRTSAGNVHT